MKLFRIKKKADGGEPERELVLDTEAPVPEAVAAVDAGDAPGAPADAPPVEAEAAPEPEADAQAKAPAPHDDLFAEISAAATSEVEAEGEGTGEPAPTGEDDPLDPGLLDIFRDAKNEAQESSFIAELDDVPISELLSVALNVGSRLGVPQRGPAPEEAPAPGDEERSSEPEPEAQEHSFERQARQSGFPAGAAGGDEDAISAAHQH